MGQSKPVSGSADVAQKLAVAIHEHRLRPGSKLNEDEVGDIFGVSRTVVRAALQQLAHQHLVDLKRNRGAFVAKPTIREAREVFEARSLLEPNTARVAAERMTEKDITQLEAHIAAEHDALAAGDDGRALYLSGTFHNEIARIADQATIAEFIAQLVSRSSLIIALYWERRAALCESHAHDALIRALRNGDGTQAEAVMKSHILDLYTALDLRDEPETPKSLKEALGA